jgi:uncharacterized membrane protein
VAPDGSHRDAGEEDNVSVGSFLKLYGATAVVFFAIDLVWLGVVAQGFYQKHLGHLLAPEVRWGPAILFYLIFIGGLLVFAILPGLGAASMTRTLALGGFLGLFAYATFDLTCAALFRSFPTAVVVVDMVWGTVLSGVVSAAGFGLGRWLDLG